MSDETEEFTQQRLERLRKEVDSYRDVLTETLVKHFEGRSTEEVIRVMAEWFNMDDLIDLTDRVAMIRKILP